MLGVVERNYGAIGTEAPAKPGPVAGHVPGVAIELGAAADTAFHLHACELLLGVGKACFDALAREDEEKDQCDTNRQNQGRQWTAGGFSKPPLMEGNTAQAMDQGGGEQQDSEHRARTRSAQRDRNREKE